MNAQMPKSGADRDTYCMALKEAYYTKSGALRAPTMLFRAGLINKYEIWINPHTKKNCKGPIVDKKGNYIPRKSRSAPDYNIAVDPNNPKIKKYFAEIERYTDPIGALEDESDSDGGSAVASGGVGAVGGAVGGARPKQRMLPPQQQQVPQQVPTLKNIHTRTIITEPPSSSSGTDSDDEEDARTPPVSATGRPQRNVRQPLPYTDVPDLAKVLEFIRGMNDRDFKPVNKDVSYVIIDAPVARRALESANAILRSSFNGFYEQTFKMQYNSMSLVDIVKRMRPDDAERHAVCFRPNFTENTYSESSCSLIAALLILQAKKKVRVSAYHLTSVPITDALSIMKLKRDLDVEVYIDNQSLNQNCRLSVIKMHLCDVGVFLNCEKKIHHDKIILLDDMLLVTGSYNFSENAEKSNFENYIATLDPDLVKAYAERFNNLKSVSKAFEYGRSDDDGIYYMMRCTGK